MMHQWIWQCKNWPHFSYDQAEVLRLLSQVRQKQGELLGRSGIASESEQAAFSLDVMLQNIITSNAIEGETLNVGSVRSSLAKRLLPHMLLKEKTSEQSEGLAKLLLDAVENTQQDLKLERLLTWHRWLFASASSSISAIPQNAVF